MGIFDNKEIEELQAQTKKLEAQIKKLKTENKDISNDLSDQKSKLAKSLKEHKKTLDMVNKTMIPWEEYRKWEKMKDKLPHIEEMYDLKKLKSFVTALPNLRSKELEYQIDYAESLHSRPNFRRDSNNDYLKDTQVYKHYIRIVTREIENAESEIRRILEKLRKHRKNKELVGLFKLYAISTDWLKPQ